MNSSSYFKLVVISITLLIVWTLRDFLLLIICSLVISNIVCNLSNQIQKGLKIPRSISLFLVLTVISVIIFSIFILVLPPFIKEFNEILVDIPNGLSKINILINTNLNKFNSLFYGEQSENVIDIFSLINNVVTIPDVSTIAKAIQESFKNLINIAGNLGSGLLRLIFVLAVSLMISIEPKQYKENVLLLIPKNYRNKFRNILEKCNIALANWTFSMVISSLSVGLLSLIVLSILDVKYVVSNALIAMVLNIIPNIGPVISGIFPISIALLDNFWKPLAVLGSYVIIQNIESYIIMPSIMKKKANLLPGLTLISQFGFTFIFGPLGLILSLPLAVVIQVLIKESFKDI
ncbi:AI-2E family transporter [Prochlorococcus marinus str. XMU1401]|uniref:AI-2E family transporter n=1 Tax=Prochlorococcus marinus str. XMU1401 TaxID=2052594 RepID=A0A8I2BGC3_PROMR|nr:AI-2E family transporter [Prochlorococcus marinus]MBO8222782.1 AI-2E family transporter [Prochlorococcus marinus str. XMU1401]MBW3061143.1 AI-2E family transporter [Prochlorococcus marinus str. XMU1401E]MCQ9197588.1 AI-2E family transporter [Prochlorococcus marinus XMU1429]PJC83978.1 AI-2E family transporter [Prochlorococcus marinus str. XMU1401]